MEWLGLPERAFNSDISRPYRVLTWGELCLDLEAPELDRKKLSILSFYVCHDRTRNCREETKQALFDRDTASWMEYFRGRLQHAQHEFTSDFAQLLVPLVTLMLRFCGAPIPRDSIPRLDHFDPNWTLGDAMDHLSQALGYPSQTLEPPATFKPNEMAIMAANSKLFGEKGAPNANEMIKEFIRSAPFGVPVSIEVSITPYFWGRLDIKSLGLLRKLLLARQMLCPALHEKSHDLAYMLMHYTFFPTKGQQAMTAWVVSEEGEQFWRERLASCAGKAGSSAILELAVIVVLYFLYTPFQRTARSGDEACSPMEELIPFLNDLGEKRRFLVSLGNALLHRIGFDRGKDCLQLVNVLYGQLPKSHDQRPTEDTYVLINDIAERGMQSREAFLSNQSLILQSTGKRQSTERRRSTGEICQETVWDY